MLNQTDPLSQLFAQMKERLRARQMAGDFRILRIQRRGVRVILFIRPTPRSDVIKASFDLRQLTPEAAERLLKP